MWEAQYYKHNTPRSLITSGGLGTMGFALPAAIGAKIARPDAEVWVVVGDGGFQMTMCELATIVQENIDINVAIINNGYLGMVRQWQEFFYEKRYAATPLVNPNFAKLAEAFGLTGITVDQARRGRADRPGRAQPSGRRRDRLPGRAGRFGVPDGAGRRGSAGDDSPAEPDCGDGRRRVKTSGTGIGVRGQGEGVTLTGPTAPWSLVPNRMTRICSTPSSFTSKTSPAC